MKKIVALGAIAALACGMVFADEPAIDIKVAELSGNAEVKWGMDLDAGQHGFTNKEEATLKVNLWNEGTKETEGDGVWADIQVKGKGLAYKNKALDGDGNASVERAKIHINDFYIDIRSGNTQVGEYKPDAAIHGDVAWLSNKGLEFKNGIQAGYDAEAFKFSLDFRSYKGTSDYTSAYGIKAEAGLKDNLVPGLTVDAGLGMNISKDFKDVTKDASIQPYVTRNDDKDADDKPIKSENDSIKDGDHTAKIYDKDKNADATLLFGGQKDYTQIAYAVKAAYKFSIDDEMYVKPSVGFRGSNATWTTAADKSASKLENELAVGALFGWGAQADANAGVPFLDGDPAKKVTPGVGVAAYIPLPTIEKDDDKTTTTYSALKAMIAPSFFLGDGKVEGLKAAAYGEIGLYNYQKEQDKYAGLAPDGYVIDSASDDGKTSTLKGIVKENETTAIAFTAGLAYGLTLDNDVTVTPKAGFRYANAAYVANKLEGKYSNIFKNLGAQNTFFEKDEDKAKSTFTGDFLNLKIGVDIGGLINNTTFSANYSSANLSNAIGEEKSTPAYTKDKKYYNVKAGTFDIGCKIAL